MPASSSAAAKAIAASTAARKKSCWVTISTWAGASSKALPNSTSRITPISKSSPIPSPARTRSGWAWILTSSCVPRDDGIVRESSTARRSVPNGRPQPGNHEQGRQSSCPFECAAYPDAGIIGPAAGIYGLAPAVLDPADRGCTGELRCRAVAGARHRLACGLPALGRPGAVLQPGTVLLALDSGLPAPDLGDGVRAQQAILLCQSRFRGSHEPGRRSLRAGRLFGRVRLPC